MAENTIPIIISALIGLLTGALGSLVAPWVSWGIEKRKFKRKTRIKLITELRDYLPDNSIQNSEFLRSYNYLRIRPFLSTRLIDDLESQTIVLHVDDPHALSENSARFMQELDVIERKWGLDIGKGKNRNKLLYDTKKAGIRISITPEHSSDLSAKKSD